MTASLRLCTLAPVGRRATWRTGQTAAPTLIPASSALFATALLGLVAVIRVPETALAVGLALLAVYQGLWVVSLQELL